MKKNGFDFVIFIGAIILCGFGAAIVSSVAPELLASQIFFYLLGLLVFLLLSFTDGRIYQSWGKMIYVVSIGLLLVTLGLGLESRGAVRWISIGALRLQFSEILKPFLILALASFLVTEWRRSFRKTLWILFLMVLPVLLIFKQPDLGSAVIFFLAFGMMLFTSGLNMGYFLGGGIVMAVVFPLFFRFLAPYQQTRILSFFRPHIDPLGSSYNAIQAVITVGSGMMFGRGLGRGTQSHLLFLPEHHTDFVFASMAEEWGFLGIVVVLIIYFILVYRILRVARFSHSRFGRLVAIGVGIMLLGQVFINSGMNLGILPVTGITLPLLSYGGSSVLATMIALGVVESIARGNFRDNGSPIV